MQQFIQQYMQPGQISGGMMKGVEEQGKLARGRAEDKVGATFGEGRRKSGEASRRAGMVAGEDATSRYQQSRAYTDIQNSYRDAMAGAQRDAYLKELGITGSFTEQFSNRTSDLLNSIANLMMNERAIEAQETNDWMQLGGQIGAAALSG
jgi:hypothetical protein